jgi:hypothetical protein
LIDKLTGMVSNWLQDGCTLARRSAELHPLICAGPGSPAVSLASTARSASAARCSPPHTAWLDDPRLCGALARSDFTLRDLKRRPMTVYLAIPPDRLRAQPRLCARLYWPRPQCDQRHTGLASPSSSTNSAPSSWTNSASSAVSTALDSLADNITLLCGYGAQLWL